MGRELLVDGLTVGYVFALSQFVMTFGLAIAYVRRSRDTFDPLREQALARAAGTLEAADAPADARASRPASRRTPPGAPTTRPLGGAR